MFFLPPPLGTRSVPFCYSYKSEVNHWNDIFNHGLASSIQAMKGRVFTGSAKNLVFSLGSSGEQIGVKKGILIVCEGSSELF